MKRATLVIVAGLFVLTATIVSMAQPVMKTVAPGKVRIGTYDNRAIAVAFAASSHNPVHEKMKALKEAKAAGDKAKLAELDAWENPINASSTSRASAMSPSVICWPP